MSNAVIKHFETVCKHKWVVFQECRACGLTWRGLIHDLSKFSHAEFIPSAKYFQGNRSPIDAEKEAIGYSFAWLHHKGRNPHHWEFWTDFSGKDGNIIANKIPYKYVVEMICDWVGAGKVYSKGDWNADEPLAYFLKVRKGRYFHPETEKLILSFLHCIKDHGLDEYHKMAKGEGIYALNRNEYEGEKKS